MKELNVNPKMFGVTVGGDLPEFYDLLKQNAEYIYGASQWEPRSPIPAQKRLPRGVQAKRLTASPRTTRRPATRAAASTSRR